MARRQVPCAEPALGLVVLRCPPQSPSLHWFKASVILPAPLALSYPSGHPHGRSLVGGSGSRDGSSQAEVGPSAALCELHGLHFPTCKLRGLSQAALAEDTGNGALLRSAPLRQLLSHIHQ